jgi:hypothetical protein
MGECCNWRGDERHLVRVDWVPGHNRGTAERSGSWAGLSETLHVSRECAEHCAQTDGEPDPWVCMVEREVSL